MFRGSLGEHRLLYFRLACSVRVLKVLCFLILEPCWLYGEFLRQLGQSFSSLSLPLGRRYILFLIQHR